MNFIINMKVLTFFLIIRITEQSLSISTTEYPENCTIPDESTSSYEEHGNWYLFDEEICGNNIVDRIIGGENASLGQYPWLARLGYATLNRKKRQIIYSCGGALITSCYVLTASHCVTDLPTNMYLSNIRLGEYNTNTEIDCYEDECADPPQDFTPLQILIHPDYDVPRYRNDIALIKLNKPATFTIWVSPICLPHGQLLNKSIAGEIADVAGWGVTNITTKKSSEILQALKVPVQNNSRCRTAFRKYIEIADNQLCAGGQVGQDSCTGDSGGPLMKVDTLTSPKFYVFGIVSFGSKHCGKRPTPGVYTKVVNYIDWILDSISEC